MGAISMKVNPASVSILIIATSFGYPYTCPLVSSHHIGFGVVLNWAHIMAHTPSP
jgi:hypothetical protein